MMQLPKHQAALSIGHNEHKSYYETIEEYLEGNDTDCWESKEHRGRAIATNSLWSMQWYPDTPVGFLRVYAPTLGELLSFAVAVGEEEA